MSQKTIMITGIGGVVGQGILRNIAELNLDIPLIGINISAVSAGNYLCDKVYKVPYSYEPGYIDAVKEIVEKENIGLIIPSTDYEAYYLSGAADKLGTVVAASPKEVTEFCLDKYKNYQAFSKYNIPFAKSLLPSEYNNEFVNTIVKPREGRGSRNIFVNPEKPKDFDDSYVVQEFLEGPEITTTFYVKRTGHLHGLITFQRELELGNTAQAEVVFDYDEEMIALILKMIEKYPFRGSCNVQSKVTSKGIIPFEINCRISGTNSLRSQFGFNDVAFTVQENFFNEEPELPNIRKGSALRVILDIIYPDISLNEIKNKNDKFYIR